MNADLSYMEATVSIVSGVAPHKTYLDGAEMGAEHGCKCGSNCQCDPCNCSK